MADAQPAPGDRVVGVWESHINQHLENAETYKRIVKVQDHDTIEFLEGKLEDVTNQPSQPIVAMPQEPHDGNPKIMEEENKRRLEALKKRWSVYPQTGNPPKRK